MCVNNNRPVLNSDATSRGSHGNRGGPQPNVQLRNGELSISGTKGADNIQVVKNGGTIEVRSGDQLIGAFRADQVRSLKVNGGKGDDQINIDVGPNVRVHVEGGKGNDRIRVENARDAYIDGGKGNDEITGRNLDSSTIKGGKGTDCIRLFDSTRLDVDGGKGDDDVRLDRVGRSRIKGGKGDDRIQLHRSKLNEVEGNGGRDDIQIDGDHNSVHGGKGEDRVAVRRGIHNRLDGGRGRDILTGERGSAGGWGGAFDRVQGDRFQQQALVTGLWLVIGLSIGLR
jgi:hypothetical protein